MDLKTIRNLQESYMAVYDNGIREKLEFESWVNNLLEEGYDLSDYTWDELYENYIQLDEGKLPLDKERRTKIGNQIGKRLQSSGSEIIGSGSAFMPKGIRNNLRQSAAKKVGEVKKMMGVLKSAQKESYDLNQLDEVSNAKVAAVSKARQKNVNKAFDKLDDSRGSSQNLATAISKQQKNQRLSAKRDKRNEAVDLYDIILSHLLDEGYADTYESAERIMVNMSEEWRDSIIETRMDPRGRPASGPMNVYANPKKPSQAHLDAVKAYDEKQKKKTPEQRKAELDAYRNRKMYS